MITIPQPTRTPRIVRSTVAERIGGITSIVPLDRVRDHALAYCPACQKPKAPGHILTNEPTWNERMGCMAVQRFTFCDDCFLIWFWDQAYSEALESVTHVLQREPTIIRDRNVIERTLIQWPQLRTPEDE